MYYLIKKKNNIPFILGQFEDYEAAEKALEHECIIVSEVNTYDQIHALIVKLTEISMENILLTKQLKQLKYEFQ